MTENKLALPLKFEFDEDGGYDAMTSGYNIINSDGLEIAVLDVSNFLDIEWGEWRDSWELRHSRNDTAEAYAAFIVRACNCHDELLATLVECVAEMSGNGSWTTTRMDVVNRACALIKKSGGD